MAKLSWISRLIKGKKSKKDHKSPPANKHQNLEKLLHMKVQEQIKPLRNDGPNEPIGRDVKGEDKQKENPLMKRENNDSDIRAQAEPTKDGYFDQNEMNKNYMNRSEKGADVLQSGNVSDPGIGRRQVLDEIANQLPFAESQSVYDLQRTKKHWRENLDFNLGSPSSVMTRMRADRGSIQRRIPISSTLLVNNQWVDVSAEPSSFTRVDEWIEDFTGQDPLPVEEDDTDHEGIKISSPSSPKASRTPARNTAHLDENILGAIQHANSIIQSLSTPSSMAHISCINLEAIPSISHFSSLKSVDLSSNYIVRITSGSLPKGLQSLNLSRNKINTIEGLRELARLRVLDLSYNRISGIGQGLSNCVLIKELYLAGNKINEIEGLHRLLKLTVLDLSFNKISTTKAIGQVVANYNSLLALNLLGNPIKSNIGDEQLRKAVDSLLPKLVYLNKQPIKPQRAREVLKDRVAKAALGYNIPPNPRRKKMKTRSSSIRSKIQTPITRGNNHMHHTPYR